MDSPVTINTLRDEQQVRDILEREERRLDDLESTDASWLARLRQRRRIRNARDSLAWLEVRQLGRDRFIIRHGIIKEGSLAAATLLGTWFLLGDFHYLQPVWEWVAYALIAGCMAGVFGGVAGWDRSEKRLAQILDESNPKLPPSG